MKEKGLEEHILYNINKPKFCGSVPLYQFSCVLILKWSSWYDDSANIKITFLIVQSVRKICIHNLNVSNTYKIDTE